MVHLEISAMTDEFSPDFKKVCEFLSSQDVKYVEIRKVLGASILTINDEQLGVVKDILNENALKVSSISDGLLKCVPPSLLDDSESLKSMGKDWRYNYSLIDRSLQVAQELDAPYIRCFSYSGRWQVLPLEKWGKWEIYQEWSKIITEMKEKAKMIEKVFICENDAGFNKSLPQIERIGKDHCGPGFGMLYDMANVANKFHFDGILTDEWLGRIGKYIQFIHAKGTRKRIFNIFHTSYINGKNDICRWPAVIEYFRNMKESDFIAPAPNPLFLSIETHFGKQPRWKYSVQNLKNLKNLLN